MRDITVLVLVVDDVLYVVAAAATMVDKNASSYPLLDMAAAAMELEETLERYPTSILSKRKNCAFFHGRVVFDHVTPMPRILPL